MQVVWNNHGCRNDMWIDGNMWYQLIIIQFWNKMFIDYWRPRSDLINAKIAPPLPYFIFWMRNDIKPYKIRTPTFLKSKKKNMWCLPLNIFCLRSWCRQKYTHGQSPEVESHWINANTVEPRSTEHLRTDQNCVTWTSKCIWWKQYFLVRRPATNTPGHNQFHISDSTHFRNPAKIYIPSLSNSTSMHRSLVELT